MRHAAGLFAIPCAVAVSALAFADTPKAPPPKIDPTAMLAPIQVQSLTLTPIVATQPAAGGDDLLVLDEAMAAKQVKIQEIADGSVNSLTFVNQADHPVFVMAGEVILGGKQDRIIGRNTVIPAKTTQAVPVFCVEHGRWNGKTVEFTTAKALAHGRLRGKASYAAQQDVWNEVSVKNKARKTESASGTYRQVAQQQSDGTLAAMEQQVNAALAKLPAADRSRMVGYAVAVNGTIATVDVFGSPQLFKKVETKLVRSYLTEAIDVVASVDAKPPTHQAIEAFIVDADKATEQKSYNYDTEAADTVVNGNERTSKSKVEYKKAPAKRAGNGAAPEPPAAPATVYQNYQAH